EPALPAHVRGPHVRLPDERPRLRAAVRPAGGRGVRPRPRRRHPGRGRPQHLRRAGERGQQAVRQPRPPAAGQGRPPRHADRRRWLPGPEGPRRDHPAGALGGRRLRHPQPRRAAGTAGAGPGRARGPGRDRRVAGDLPLGAALPPGVGVLGLGGHLGGLRQHLHLLHRPVAARHREGPPARRRPGRGGGAGRAGRAGGHPARPERQLLRPRVRRPVRLRRPAAGRRGRRRAGAGPVHLAAPAGLHRRRDRRDGRDPGGLPLAAHAAAVRLGRGAAGDAPVLPAGALPRDPVPGPGRDAGRRDHHRHHRRLPRRDRGRLRRDAVAGRGGPLRRRVHLPVLTPPRDAGRHDGRPGAPRGRPGAVRAAGRRAGRGGAGGEPGAGRLDRRGAGGRGRGPQGRRDRAAVRAGPRRSAGALRLRGRGGPAGRRGDHRGHLRRPAPPGRRLPAAVAPADGRGRRVRGRPPPGHPGGPRGPAGDADRPRI
ncbi:MAG: tRNA-i(6)A37 methylthiotransferase, partial [uncultured Corynebacteriales bacterium]